MNKIPSILIAAGLAIGMAGNAVAGPDHHRHYDRYYDRHAPRVVQKNYYYPPPPRRVHRDYDWVAPAAILTLGAVALGTAISQSTPPATVYTSPPPPPPRSDSWYFCRSSGMYYPYTKVCPEGWRAVPATP